MKSQIKFIILIVLSLLSIISPQEGLEYELEFLKERELKANNKSNSASRLSGGVPDFASYVFSIQWGNTLCIPSADCREKTKTWKKNVFTIHGLWPNGPNGEQLPTCNTLQKINFQINDSNLQEKMDLHWPSLTGPNTKFWEHEYNKHGFCYSNKYGGSQTEFFRKGMELFLNFGFEELASDLMKNDSEEEVEISMNDLKNIINSKFPNMVYDLDCKLHNKTNYLQEIRFYFDLDFMPFNPPKERKKDCIFGPNLILQKMLNSN
jgi:ribonuclease I